MSKCSRASKRQKAAHRVALKVKVLKMLSTAHASLRIILNRCTAEWNPATRANPNKAGKRRVNSKTARSKTARNRVGAGNKIKPVSNRLKAAQAASLKTRRDNNAEAGKRKASRTDPVSSRDNSRVNRAGRLPINKADKDNNPAAARDANLVGSRTSQVNRANQVNRAGRVSRAKQAGKTVSKLINKAVNKRANKAGRLRAKHKRRRQPQAGRRVAVSASLKASFASGWERRKNCAGLSVAIPIWRATSIAL